MSPNLQAFLDMIATSEGTIDIGEDGYNALVGSTPSHPLLFSSYADHPHVFNKVSDSTAAGRYQFLYKTWEALKAMLDLPDFSPTSQDAGAIELIKERDALDDVEAGNFTSAVEKCSNIWASLPGNNYGQRENTLANLQEAYTRAGGTLA